MKRKLWLLVSTFGGFVTPPVLSYPGATLRFENGSADFLYTRPLYPPVGLKRNGGTDALKDVDTDIIGESKCRKLFAQDLCNYI